MRQVIATGKKIIGDRSYESRIDREQSPLKMRVIPIVSVVMGSMMTALPFFPTGPILPPFGLLIFLAWRLMRPGIWPAWIGLPFGLVDDLYSGAPFGTAGLLWSGIMLAMELIDSRAAWRDYIQDWLIAAVAIIITLSASLAFIGLAHRTAEVEVILPQIVISILIFPLIVRLCARLDAWRLAT